ncbi:ADP-ribosylglycohydrolase family protein [Desulfovibrio sp.]|uniref:ADP-ribosylglycohydrolase family protein n=1 Tax=Desulfovibrio sp. TaxID=885 RepID=UPI0023D247D6|nr:ADP-ribosylglycohydrolase family protein [Desulfovibrio sp.]MDE7241575.1 ADP-ribosylglycohydrolase family protein [Desulfovibrio sp.]
MDGKRKTVDKQAERIRALLLGVAVGDALGVPVEFRPRGSFRIDGMRGHGTHDQPAGTWSDDTSLTLALADAIAGDAVSLPRLARNFIAWHDAGAFTPHGAVFDVGNATARAIGRLKRGVPPEQAGGTEERDNGNGSLMRVAPLVFLLAGRGPEARFRIIKAVSSVTHAHAWSVTACFIFLEALRKLTAGIPKEKAYAELREDLATPPSFLDAAALEKFRRILKEDIRDLPEADIRSSGFVVDTLEAALWSFLTTDTYRDAVLRAVNLGEDTDTTGAVTGALAAAAHGPGSIPEEWISQLRGREQIDRMAESLAHTLTLPGADADRPVF